EEAFFQAGATGGTIASSAFQLTLDIFDRRYPAARYNHYVFYASDGDNFGDDRELADRLLCRLGTRANFMGFVETPQNPHESGRSETGRLVHSLQVRNYPVGTYTVHDDSAIWDAIRQFFNQQAQTETAQADDA